MDGLLGALTGVKGRFSDSSGVAAFDSMAGAFSGRASMLSLRLRLAGWLAVYPDDCPILSHHFFAIGDLPAPQLV